MTWNRFPERAASDANPGRGVRFVLTMLTSVQHYWQALQMHRWRSHWISSGFDSRVVSSWLIVHTMCFFLMTFPTWLVVCFVCLLCAVNSSKWAHTLLSKSQLMCLCSYMNQRRRQCSRPQSWIWLFLCEFIFSIRSLRFSPWLTLHRLVTFSCVDSFQCFFFPHLKKCLHNNWLIHLLKVNVIWMVVVRKHNPQRCLLMRKNGSRLKSPLAVQYVKKASLLCVDRGKKKKK